MHTYRIHLMYDGTNYSGWQIQPNATSIQQLVHHAVQTFVKEEVSIVGSGRTDAGVHALELVAHFRCSKKLNTALFFRSINGLLPHDIRLTQVSEVDAHFHAQKSATKKEYHYRICLNPFVSPFQRLYCLHVRYRIDETLLKKACKRFVGTHDFSSFANQAHSGAAKKNPVRTIYRLDAVPTDYGIRLEFEGNGFLYKMVRNIVGMILAIASKKRPLEDIERLFLAKDRRLAPQGVKACGLFLVKMTY